MWVCKPFFSILLLSLASFWDRINSLHKWVAALLNSNPDCLESNLMNEHVKNFNQRLIGIFELKAEEFTKHSQDNPLTSKITAEIAGMYSDLVEIMKRWTTIPAISRKAQLGLCLFLWILAQVRKSPWTDWIQ